MSTGIIERSLGSLADRLGIEAGQTYTIVTGVALALVLAVFGLPPVLDHAGESVATAAVAGGELPVTPPTTTPSPGAMVPGPTATAPTPASNAAPPTTLRFHAPPPPAPNAPITTTTTTTSPAPRPPIPNAPPPEPDGTTTVLARVPQPGAPDGVGVGPDGVVYVATNNGGGRGGVGPSEIIVFTPSGQTIGSFSITGQPDDRTAGLTGLAVDRVGRVVVADASTNRLLRLDPSRSDLSELVTIPDLASCLVTLDADCEPGAIDGAPELHGVSISPDGSILVADRGQGIVWGFDSHGLHIAYSVDDRTPGEGPTAAAMRGNELIVAVSGLADTVPPGQAAVLSVVDGTATRLTTYDGAADLRGLTVGNSGRIYVTLAGAGTVDAIGPDGVVDSYDGGDVEPGFDEPTGIAVADGRLLVTNQSTTTNDADHWVVYAVAVNDHRHPSV